MGKRGENLKFYLSPEDKAIFEMAMEQDHYDTRGHYLMHLIKLRNSIKQFRMDRAKEVKEVILRFGLSKEELDLT